MTPRNEESDGIAGDLHLHTTESDGTDTVEERVEQARELGLQAIAITDHDGISNDLPDRQTEVDGVEVITGVEAKAQIEDVKVDVLGYYVDPESDELDALLEEIRSYRRERNRVMFDRLVDAADLDVEYSEVEKLADGQVGRPHFVHLLVDEGRVNSVSEAFERYLSEDGDVYVPTEKVDYTRAIDAIHAADGIASVAHPGRIDADESDRMTQGLIQEMAEYGLDALEVWYPYDTIGQDRLSDFGVEEALQATRDYELLRTGGSDCHGSGSDKHRIGATGVSEEDLQGLRKTAL